MNDLGNAFVAAWRLIAGLDAELVDTVLLSLGVSLTATVIGFLVGATGGAFTAVFPYPGRRAVILVAHALLGLPPVVVGLLVYIALSRSGPLGFLGLLFTPGAMIIAQAILVTPISLALTHRLMTALWARYGEALVMDGASRPRALATLAAAARRELVTVFLAAFGRAISEVGAIIVVGGNIRGSTRTMTTTIALETSKGDLPLAIGIGLILIALTLIVATASLLLGRGRPEG